MKRKYSHINKDIQDGYKTCLDCFDTKLLELFNIDKTGKFGRKSICKNCDSIKRKNKWNLDDDFKKNWLKKSSVWRQNNKQYYSNYQKQLRIDNPNQKIKENFYALINYHLKKKNLSKKNKIKYLGISIEEYKKYLENLFEIGMTWENKGQVWEIDHKQPLVSFDLTKEENIKKAFYYTNTQPLFKTTDIAKSFGSNNIGNKNKHKKIL